MNNTSQNHRHIGSLIFCLSTSRGEREDDHPLFSLFSKTKQMDERSQEFRLHLRSAWLGLSVEGASLPLCHALALQQGRTRCMLLAYELVRSRHQAQASTSGLFCTKPTG